MVVTTIASEEGCVGGYSGLRTRWQCIRDGGGVVGRGSGGEEVLVDVKRTYSDDGGSGSDNSSQLGAMAIETREVVRCTVVAAAAALENVMPPW